MHVRFHADGDMVRTSFQQLERSRSYYPRDSAHTPTLEESTLEAPQAAKDCGEHRQRQVGRSEGLNLLLPGEEVEFLTVIGESATQRFLVGQEGKQ